MRNIESSFNWRKKKESFWKSIKVKINILKEFAELLDSLDYQTPDDELKQKLTSFFIEKVKINFSPDILKIFMKCGVLVEKGRKLRRKIQKIKSQEELHKLKSQEEKIAEKLSIFLDNNELRFLLLFYCVIEKLIAKHIQVKEINEEYQKTGKLKYLPEHLKEKEDEIKSGIIDIQFGTFDVIVTVNEEVWPLLLKLLKIKEPQDYHEINGAHCCGTPYIFIVNTKNKAEKEKVIFHERLHNFLENAQLHEDVVLYIENLENLINMLKSTSGKEVEVIKELIRELIYRFIDALHEEFLADWMQTKSKFESLIKGLINKNKNITKLWNYIWSAINDWERFSIKDEKEKEKIIEICASLSPVAGSYFIDLLKLLSKAIETFSDNDLKDFFYAMKRRVELDFFRLIKNLFMIYKFILTSENKNQQEELMSSFQYLSLILKPSQYHHIIEYLERQI